MRSSLLIDPLVINILPLVIGYILGSISPSYFLGKLIKRIDLREYGTKNLGTVNTAKELGIIPAIVPAIYDTLKGVIAIFIAQKLGAKELFAYIAGIFAIIGHVFPFYLKFKGGQGVATSTGLLIRNLIVMYMDTGFQTSSLVLLLALLFLVLSITWITSGEGKTVGVVVLPILPYLFIYYYKLNLTTVFTCLVIGYILFIDIFNIVREGGYVLRNETKTTLKFWRFVLRPVALLFLVFNEYISSTFALVILGAVTSCFLVFDIIRLSHSKINLLILRSFISIFKQKEEHRLSSMTLFLIAYTITFLLFDKPIVYTVITFLIFGDMFAKFFGLQYGRMKLLNKTLEGTMAHLSACIVAGLIVSNHFPIVSSVSLHPSLMALIGAGVSTIVEVIPMGVDDNLSIALITAIILRIL